MKDATEQDAEAAIVILKRMIDAAENSNQAGENAVVKAVRAFNNHEALMDALIKIAAFNDKSASEFLDQTGSYSCFDEPGSVELARATIANAEKG